MTTSKLTTGITTTSSLSDTGVLFSAQVTLAILVNVPLAIAFNVISKTCDSPEFNEEIFNIAIGDVTGSIKLFKFPIFSKDQKAVTIFNYHTKEITHMNFGIIDGKYILISSSSDGVLIVWEIKKI